jgi:acid phosphatase type 7
MGCTPCRMTPRRFALATVCLPLLLALAACRAAERVIPDAADASALEELGLSGDAVTLVGAGDIANCATKAPSRTAALLAKIPGAVFTLGDNAYPDGTLDDYLDCFEPSWGRERSRMHPTIGNHEYHVPHAGAYFAYFGEAAGAPFKGRYSYDVGSWHVISLNSNCVDGRLPNDIDIGVTSQDFGGCGSRSEQADWLRADLAAHPNACTIAMWHHPRFSSGYQGDFDGLTSLWSILVEHGVDVVLSGHDHDYERFAPQLADGTRDDARGIREFVVGTGGTALRAMRATRPNSEVRQATTHGVLKLTLRADDYDWEFVPVAGEPAFADKGHGTCH